MGGLIASKTAEIVRLYTECTLCTHSHISSNPGDKWKFRSIQMIHTIRNGMENGRTRKTNHTEEKWNFGNVRKVFLKPKIFNTISEIYTFKHTHTL